MKNNLLLILSVCLIFSLSSCGSGSEKSSPADAATSVGESGSTSTSGSSCDAFLEDYERFTTNYMDVLKRFAEDPTNSSMLNEINKYTQETETWASKWSSIATDCASDPAFTQKYVEITNRITSAAGNLY